MFSVLPPAQGISNYVQISSLSAFIIVNNLKAYELSSKNEQRVTLFSIVYHVEELVQQIGSKTVFF